MGNPHPGELPAQLFLTPLEATLSRRQVFALSGVVAVTAWYKADETVTDQHWPDSPTWLYVLEGASHEPDGNGWLANPGFGSIHGVHMAHQVRSNHGISHAAPVGAYVYGNSEAHAPELKKQARNYAAQRKLGSLSMYCHSMGGVIGMNNAQAVGLPLHDVILNGSPYDIDDACNSIMAHFGAMAKDADPGFKGGVTLKYFGELYNRFTRYGSDGVLDFFRNFKYAAEDTWSSASPKMLSSQLQILKDYPLSPDVVDGIAQKGVTRVSYCMPRIPGADRTVHDLQAYFKYKAMFGRHGIRVDQIYLPHLSHADTGDCMAHTGEWLKEGRLHRDPAA